MRKLLLLIPLCYSFNSMAQSTLENLPLPTADTYYVNFTMPGQDVGFGDGGIHYPCVYDTSGGYSFLSSGFVYSNKKDSVTSGFVNQFSAKTGAGHNMSAKYAVAYGQQNMLKKTVHLHNQWQFLYVTNSTYAYNSMRDGDAFAKKFGGASGNDSDWFKLTIKGFVNGVLKPDSVVFYLADFRFADNSKDYIVRDWRKVMLDSLTAADSLQFSLSSSDVGMFGMNTPAYFCLDDIDVVPTGVGPVSFASFAGISPNPAINYLHLDIKDETVKEVFIMDVAGRQTASFPVSSRSIDINTSTFPAGQYLLKLSGKNGAAVTRFVKQ